MIRSKHVAVAGVILVGSLIMFCKLNVDISLKIDCLGLGSIHPG